MNEKYYVYRYMHPDFPWLYVGSTTNLEKRIWQHRNSSSDNISREHLSLIILSQVYYVSVSNTTEMRFLEKYLIDKYKPLLNKKDKLDNGGTMELKGVPKWKKYELCSDSISILYKRISSMNKEIDRLKEINNKLSRTDYPTLFTNNLSIINNLFSYIERLLRCAGLDEKTYIFEELLKDYPFLSTIKLSN